MAAPRSGTARGDLIGQRRNSRRAGARALAAASTAPGPTRKARRAPRGGIANKARRKQLPRVAALRAKPAGRRRAARRCPAGPRWCAKRRRRRGAGRARRTGMRRRWAQSAHVTNAAAMQACGVASRHRAATRLRNTRRCAGGRRKRDGDGRRDRGALGQSLCPLCAAGCARRGGAAGTLSRGSRRAADSAAIAPHARRWRYAPTRSAAESAAARDPRRAPGRKLGVTGPRIPARDDAAARSFVINGWLARGAGAAARRTQLREQIADEAVRTARRTGHARCAASVRGWRRAHARRCRSSSGGLAGSAAFRRGGNDARAGREGVARRERGNDHVALAADAAGGPSSEPVAAILAIRPSEGTALRAKASWIS